MNGGIMKRICFLLLLAVFSTNAEAGYLYKAMFVRAAPGKLLDLIALYKERMPVYDASGDERPFWMRHSQGDQWDLMFVFPMESFSAYYEAGRVTKRNHAAMQARLPQAEFAKKFYELVAWHEELFVDGPALAQVREAFSVAGFFHVEIFLALPGKQAELYKEREMENAYLKALSRPSNLIFTHEQGAAWDLFTIGFYRDLKHYAESADIPDEKEEDAAKSAGFAGANFIGTYLRTLIAEHHDTLAVAVK
jgi:hypothetical protein